MAMRERGPDSCGTPAAIRPLRWRPLRVVCVLLAVLLLGTAYADDRPPPQPGQQMPPFALFDLQGNLHRLSDYREPVLVINFFAYWCDTWVAQLPQLRELARQQQEMGFRLISISIDGQWADVRGKYLGDQPLPFPVLLDSRRTLAPKLGLRHVPTVMVLDRQRRVTWLHEAYPGNPQVLAAVRKAASGGAAY